jgi:hypothetical protein
MITERVGLRSSERKKTTNKQNGSKVHGYFIE